MEYLSKIKIFGLIFFVQISLFAQSSNIATTTSSVVDEVEPSVKKAISKKDIKNLNVNAYGDLINIESRDLYSVVEKIELTKKSRFQFGLGANSGASETLYSKTGLDIQLNYYLNETWGLGLRGGFFDNSQNSAIANIKNKQLVTAVDTVTYVKNYNEIQLFLIPIYGKWSISNNSIVNFETFFAIGSGRIQDQFNNSTSSFSAEVGQLVALGPSSAINFSIKSLFFESIGLNAKKENTALSVFNIGYSVFFPESINR